MQRPGPPCRALNDRWRAPLALVIGAVLLAACSTAIAPATKQAQGYAASRNLKLLDLPSGWSSQGPATNSSGSTASTLSDSQTKSAKTLLASLPASCRVLDSTFKASLVGAPPVGTTAQNEAKFTSASDGNAAITSTVVVFATLKDSQSTYGLYSAATFPQCLQEFLLATLKLTLTGAKAVVAVAPTAAPPSGVQTTAFTVFQSGRPSGSQAQVSTAEEAVIQSGKAMAFLEVGGATTSLPVDAQNVFNQSVSVVEHRLVPPPA
jgi:hypothetical protein